jgi:hypothetical protein|nr:MAG TPA: hypothetical protein [Caudoviricetes sp.]
MKLEEQDVINHRLGLYVRSAFHSRRYLKEPFLAKDSEHTNTRRFTTSKDLDAYINAHIEQEKQ